MSSKPTPPSSSKRSPPTRNHLLPTFSNPLRRRNNNNNDGNGNGNGNGNTNGNQNQPTRKSKQQQQKQQQKHAPPQLPSDPTLTTRILARIKMRTRETTQAIRLRITTSNTGDKVNYGAARIPLTERNMSTFLAELRQDREDKGEEDVVDDDDVADRGEKEEELDDVHVDEEREKERRREEILRLQARRERRVVNWLDGVG